MSSGSIDLGQNFGAPSVEEITASYPIVSTGGVTPNISIAFTPENVANKGIANGYPSLDGAGKIPVSQLPSSVLEYLGAWNASTNTPTLADGVGVSGSLYRVSVAGTQNLGSGNIVFFVGDFVIYNGSIWERSPLSDGVISVFGRAGVVVATSGDYTVSQVTGAAPLASPALTGSPTAPTATVGDSSTLVATTAYVQSQGFLSSASGIPTGSQSNASTVTSASTTFVNALTTTVTLTTTAPIVAIATATLTTTTLASVARIRTSINGVASQVQDISLTATGTNYSVAMTQLSTSLAPGTYTVNFDISRLSGTGTVNYIEGTLVAEGLQGAASNGITRLTGDVTAGPGSGTQAATIAAGAVTGAKIASATIAGSNIASATITNTNIASVDASKITTGTLGVARGGTGATAFANQRVPFSNGTILTTDALYIYDTTNTRLSVGGSGSATINAIVSSGSKTALQAFNSSSGNAFQASNTTAYSCYLTCRANSALQGASLGFEFGRGTLASPTQALSGDLLGIIVATGYTGTQTAPGFSGDIAFIASENVTNTTNGGDVVIGATPNGTLTPIERVRILNSGQTQLSNSHLKSTQATTTTVAANANAGTSASASLTNATDVAGIINLTMGSASFASGAQVGITFGVAYAVAPIVVFAPANAVSASSSVARNIYVGSITTTGFSILFGQQETAAGTIYKWNYWVIETQ